MVKSIIYIWLGLLMPIAIGNQNAGEITIFLVGDSTMADKPFKDGNPEKGWGQVFPLYLKEGVRVENHAVNGRSTKSFRDEGKWDVVIDRVKEGDYVIIEFGHNDSKKQDPNRYAEANTDYRANLIGFIEEVIEKKANPVLATPIVRRKFIEGKLVETHGDYPEVVRDVARQLNVPLLDLHQKTKELLIQYGEERSKQLFLQIEPGEYPSIPEGKTDNTHLSPTGAFRVCDLVVGEVKRVLPQLEDYIKK